MSGWTVMLHAHHPWHACLILAWKLYMSEARSILTAIACLQDVKETVKGVHGVVPAV